MPVAVMDQEGQPDMYRRRMLTVQRAKELYDAGIKVFVVGFGENMSDPLKKTLNWAAKYGGTDNPLEENSGDPNAYDITKYGSACSTTDTNANPENYPLSGYAFLATECFPTKECNRNDCKIYSRKILFFYCPFKPHHSDCR